MAKRKKHNHTEISRDVEWVKLTLTEDDLNAMVIEGIIPDRETGEWRLATGELFLTPHTHEIVVFEAYFVQGFRLPAHPFLFNLLQYYGINLYHLNPNNILHISTFINLCEPFARSISSKLVGGCYLVLRDRMASQYIQVPLNTLMKGWNTKWFYI